MAGSGYVRITRWFRPVDEELHTGPRWLRSTQTQSGWAELLSAPEDGGHSAIVLLAPSGSGKTTEMRERARASDPQVAPAFWIEAGRVARDGLIDALACAEEDFPGQEQQFAQWMKSTKRACFFVDAVDELHLQRQQLRDLTTQLARGLDPRTRDLTLVLSARNGAWPEEYTQHLSRMLLREDPRGEGRSPLNPVIKLVTFASLDRPAIEALAATHNVLDAPRFADALEECGLDAVLTLRPCDVPVFTDYWKEHRRLGPLVEMIGRYVDGSFEDPARHQEWRHTLSTANGTKGLVRVGAASILGKRPLISIPASVPPPGVQNGRKLFDDWVWKSIQELFENALFVHKGAEAVQLSPGPIPNYLAGRWLATRIAGGMAVDDLVDLLFVRLFGARQYRLPGSWRALVGWTASLSPTTRSTLTKLAPEVVLYDGDPSTLSEAEICEALTAHARTPSVDRLRFPSPYVLRHLARPGLEARIRSLLSKVDRRSRVLAELLELAMTGRYGSCLNIAVDIALDGSADTIGRTSAVGFVAELGKDSHADQLLPLLGSDDEHIRAALLGALIPGHLGGTQLVAFLRRGAGHWFSEDLRKARALLSMDELDTALAAIGGHLAGSILDAQTETDFQLAAVLLPERLSRPIPVTQSAVSIIQRLDDLSSAPGSCFLSDGARQELNKALEGNVNARRMLWEARLSSTEYFPWNHGRELGALRVEDLEWAIGLLARVDSDGASRLRQVVDRLYLHQGDEQRQQLLEDPTLPSTARAWFEALRDSQAQQKEAQGKRLAAEQREAAERRAANVAALLPHIAGIESGVERQALLWGWSHVERQRTDARLDMGALHEAVGEELAAAFARGLQRLWRTQPISLRPPEDSTIAGLTLAGLTGLSLAVRDGLDFATISPDDAKLAAIYATYESGGLPDWFGKLVAAQPDAAKNVLAEAVRAEWLTTKEHYCLLRRRARTIPS